MQTAMNGRAGRFLTWPVRANFRATARSRNTPARSGMHNPVPCHEEKPRMTISPLAGKPAPKEMLIDPARLEREYFERKPDLDDPGQLVSFGTSGHRGSPLHGSFTEAHGQSALNFDPAKTQVRR